MSAARAERRRTARAGTKGATGLPTTTVTGDLPPSDYYGTAVAWCATSRDLPDARRISHDALIADMGDRRTGAVHWIHSHGHKALQMLAALAAEQRMAIAPGVHDRLVHDGGYLVVALAPGEPPTSIADEAQP